MTLDVRLKAYLISSTLRVEIIQKLSSKIIQKLFSNNGLISDKSEKSVVLIIDHWGRFSMITFRGARLWHAYLGVAWTARNLSKSDSKSKRCALKSFGVRLKAYLISSTLRVEIHQKLSSKIIQILFSNIGLISDKSAFYVNNQGKSCF